MALGLLRLAALSGDRAYEQQAEGRPAPLRQGRPAPPDAFAHLLRALDFHLSPTKEVALIGDDLRELAAVVRSGYRPHQVLAGGPEGSATPPLLSDRPAMDDKPTAYVCESFTCQAPTTDAGTLATQL